MAGRPPSTGPARGSAPARTRGAARLLSIVGHPALVMPVAVTLAAAQRATSGSMPLRAAGLAVAVAAIVGAYSGWQVRAGRWRHVDASVPGERHQLNRFVAGLLLGLAALLWATRQPPALVVGLGVGAGIVGVALALQRWLKVSLHGAFGAFAAALAWPLVPATAVLGALALGVGWSRLRLGRHDAAEVVVGLCLGGAAGVAFHWGAAAL